MSHRSAVPGPILLAAMMLLPHVGPTIDTPPERFPQVEVAAQLSPSPTEVATAHQQPIDVSLSPAITIREGTAEQHRRLELALLRFKDAGLALPDLEVVFATDLEPCKGHPALFETRPVPWRISFCSDLDPAYEHELAHAWARVDLTDGQKERFMELRGYGVWSGASVPWNERGSEGVAFIIQQGLGGLPLPSSLSEEQLSRLDAFELLTGIPDTRLDAWEARHGPGSLEAVPSTSLRGPADGEGWIADPSLVQAEATQ